MQLVQYTATFSTLLKPKLIVEPTTSNTALKIHFELPKDISDGLIIGRYKLYPMPVICQHVVSIFDFIDVDPDGTLNNPDGAT